MRTLGGGIRGTMFPFRFISGESVTFHCESPSQPDWLTAPFRQGGLDAVRDYSPHNGITGGEILQSKSRLQTKDFKRGYRIS